MGSARRPGRAASAASMRRYPCAQPGAHSLRRMRAAVLPSQACLPPRMRLLRLSRGGPRLRASAAAAARLPSAACRPLCAAPRAPAPRRFWSAPLQPAAPRPARWLSSSSSSSLSSSVPLPLLQASAAAVLRVRRSNRRMSSLRRQRLERHRVGAETPRRCQQAPALTALKQATQAHRACLPSRAAAAAQPRGAHRTASSPRQEQVQRLAAAPSRAARRASQS